MNDVTYKDYVKEELWKDFVKQCKSNCLDFYSCGVVLSAHIVLEHLMKHTYKGVWKGDKETPKETWEGAMEQTDFHSGASASMVAIMVARYSPRGEEFKKWCKKDDIVMVKW